MADEPIIIVDHSGNEHEFPAGFDPKRAAMIVSQQVLAKANATPLKEPSTYWGGVAKVPLAKSTLDALPGVGAIVGGALSTPESLGAGTIPGVALGAAAGRGLRDIIGHITGIDAPSTPLEKAANIGIEGTVAAGTQAVLPGVVEAAKAPVQTLREASEQFGSAMPPAIRRLGRLMPRLPAPPARTPVVTPDFLAGETAEPVASQVTAPAAAPAVSAGLSAVDRAALVKQGYAPDVIAKIEAQIAPVASHAPAPVTPSIAPVASHGPITEPQQGHLLDPGRRDVGAEVIGRQQGMTKQEVRNLATPVLDESQGAASPVLPQASIDRMAKALRALPPGAAREDYVRRATSGKAMAAAETIRRTFEAMGLLVPAAVAGGMTLRGRMISSGSE